MIKRMENQRFEFVLYINKHIICQRYFSMFDYNENVIRSLEMKTLMDRLVGMNNGSGSLGVIPNSLKYKSSDYLWKNYNGYYAQKTDTPKNLFEKEDMFDFEIKIDGNTVAQSTFSGNYFPLDIRYQVDIKEVIPTIISEIKSAFTQKKYTTKYADTVL